MKKNFFLLLFFCLVYFLGFTSCKVEENDENPSYNFETDCQYYHITAIGSYHIAESPECYYYISEKGYLRAVEKATMKDFILCNKPECLHDKLETEYESEKYGCNAYVSISGNGCLNYYNGHLYGLFKHYSPDIGVSSSFVLTRFSLDGTKRKDIWTMDWEDENIKGYPLSSTIHRGKFYFILQDVQSSGEIKSYVFCYDLKTGKNRLLYYEDGHAMNLKILGNTMYLRVERDYLLPELIEYDLVTGDYTLREDCCSVHPFQGKRLYYDTATDGTTIFHTLSFRNPDGSEEETFDTVDLNDVPKYCKTLHFYENYLFVRDGAYGEEIRVYDTETGEKISSLAFPEKCSSWGHSFFSCSSDGKIFLYTTFDKSFKYPIFYCSINEIGTPDFQWHEVEKVN